ncbi:hypothetical protein FRC07_002929 [Ceratobasidium sp. 392]|nr:hypothetical protein FRC07_002929 [Ceratobasidium sp. 392]
MSLTRSLLSDFRPLFRLIEDPFFSAPSYALSRGARPESWRPFAGLQRQAAVELSEDGNEIVVQAEVPGVQKENLDVHLGSDGQSLTIEGRVHRVGKASQPALAPSATQQATEKATTDVAKSNAEPESEYRSSFTRTLWLPQPVDGTKAKAELADGVLTLRIPKREQLAAERIAIN